MIPLKSNFPEDLPYDSRSLKPLSYSDSLANAALESTADGILVVDREGRIVRWNCKFAELWKIPAELLSTGNDALVLDYAITQLSKPEQFLAKVLELYGHPEESSEDQLELADGRYFDRYSQPLRIGNEIIGRFWSFRDITARKQAEEKLCLMAQVFEHSGEAIVVTDSKNRILAINSSFTRLTGYTLEDVTGKDPGILKSGRESSEFYAAMWKTLHSENYWQGEIWDKRKDGSFYPKWLAITVVRNGNGEITNYIGSFTDISERKQAAEKIEFMAYHDTLTKLHNRFSLMERLSQALLLAKRSGKHLAVMFIDLDNFKNINDSLGHSTGDKLLFQVASRLLASVRSSDIVARFGGDEFVIVLPQVQSGIITVSFTSKIQQVISETYHIDNHKLYITPSIGISVFPHDGESAEDLMKHADIAMYHAKSRGRNNFQFFKSEMNLRAHERISMEIDLRRAIAREELLLHYQPQIEMATGNVIGVEALVRWQHPERGLIPPDSFIPLAEETGLILQVGDFVIRTACRQLKKWLSEGISPLRVAINLSARQFRQDNLCLLVEEIIAENGIDPRLLEMEITESAAMDNPRATILHLGSFMDLGVELAIDDFGTGYSSLSYLKMFPVNRLKIDRSFVKDIETDTDDAAIAAATIALAHTLGKQVVAEGVETKAQLEFLKNHKCDIIQGYYYSRPLPPDEVSMFIRMHHAKSVKQTTNLREP